VSGFNFGIVGIITNRSTSTHPFTEEITVQRRLKSLQAICKNLESESKILRSQRLTHRIHVILCQHNFSFVVITAQLLFVKRLVS